MRNMTPHYQENCAAAFHKVPLVAQYVQASSILNPSLYSTLECI